MWINGRRHKYFKRNKNKFLRVHLGPGQKNYLDGWINLDANIFSGVADFWVDLRHQLPFKPNSVDAFYSHHVIEHLPDLKAHMRDVFRCLKPGGHYRVCGPNGDSAVRKYVEGDIEWFSDFPETYESIGGKLHNFLYCKGEHLAVLTPSFFEEIATSVGFIQCEFVLPVKETKQPELFSDCLETEFGCEDTFPRTIAMECRKPW